MARPLTRFLPLIVLIIALTARLAWLGEKAAPYGDELTSLALAYDAPGWGDKTFATDSAYTGSELRRLLYTDEGRGLSGLRDDLATLYHHNRDASHASLYYMLLRVSLTGSEATDPATVARRACLPNVLFFLISYCALWALLRRLYPERPGLIAACLFVAFLNPASVSLTLLVREYALAECLFSLWALYTMRTARQIGSPRPLAARTSYWLAGLLLGACLLSSGYFNALFLLFTLAWLLWICRRNQRWRRDGLALLVLPLGILLVAWLMYPGFFHFLTDVRTHEVSGKLQGSGWFANALTSLKQGLRMLLCNVFTPIGALALLAALVLRRRKYAQVASRRKSQRNYNGWEPFPTGGRTRLWAQWSTACTERLSSPATALCLMAALWIAAAIWLSPWKMTHYFSPAVPLLMALLTAWTLSELSGRSTTDTKATFQASAACSPSDPGAQWLSCSVWNCLRRHPFITVTGTVCSFTFLAWQLLTVEHLNLPPALPTAIRTAPTVYLYGPDADERNTLTLLSPTLGDGQKCIILPSRTAVAGILDRPSAVPVYIYAYRDCTPLRTLPGYLTEQPFNDWMDLYVFRP